MRLHPTVETELVVIDKFETLAVNAWPSIAPPNVSRVDLQQHPLRTQRTVPSVPIQTLVI